MFEDLRRQSDQRAGPFDTFGGNLVGDLIEPLDNSVLVARLKPGIEQIAHRADHRIVTIDKLAQGGAQRRLRGGETADQHLKPGITPWRRDPGTRQYLHREAVQGLDLEPCNSTTMAGNDPNQMMPQAARRHDDTHWQNEIFSRRCREAIDLLEQSSLRSTGARAGNDAGMDVWNLGHFDWSHGTTGVGHCQRYQPVVVGRGGLA